MYERVREAHRVRETKNVAKFLQNYGSAKQKKIERLNFTCHHVLWPASEACRFHCTPNNVMMYGIAFRDFSSSFVYVRVVYDMWVCVFIHLLFLCSRSLFLRSTRKWCFVRLSSLLLALLLLLTIEIKINVAHRWFSVQWMRTYDRLYFFFLSLFLRFTLSNTKAIQIARGRTYSLIVDKSQCRLHIKCSICLLLHYKTPKWSNEFDNFTANLSFLFCLFFSFALYLLLFPSILCFIYCANELFGQSNVMRNAITNYFVFCYICTICQIVYYIQQLLLVQWKSMMRLPESCRKMKWTMTTWIPFHLPPYMCCACVCVVHTSGPCLVPVSA